MAKHTISQTSPSRLPPQAQRTQRKIQEQALMGPQATPVQRESLMQIPAPGTRHPLPSAATSGRSSLQTNGPNGSASSVVPGTAGVRPPSMFQAFQASNRAGQQQQLQQGQPAPPSFSWGRPPSGLSHAVPASGPAESALGQSASSGLGMHVDEEFEEGSLARPSLLGVAAGPAVISSRGLMPYAQVRLNFKIRG